MRIKHYLTYDEPDKDITDLIDELGIPYNGDYGVKSFWLYEDDEAYLKIEPHIKSGKVLDSPANAMYEYTHDEINSSDWFSIRSNHYWSYPQPEDKYINITYDSKSTYCQHCGQGLIQKESFIMKKEPQWGRRNFLHLNWVYDELFINERILNDFASQKFSGIELVDVKLNKKIDVLHTVKQIKIDNILNQGMIIENPRKIIKCKSCGRIKFILGFTGISKFKKEAFDSFTYDFGKSYEVFGDGLIAARKIIISKKVLNYILNREYKEIVYEPIILV